MNKRLETILSHIDTGVGVIDVGTDHGYLPAALAERGYTGHLFASDIHKGPLDTAARTAQRAGVSDQIRFILCDGLDECPPEAVDTIVIAGMGGDMICRILDRAEWCMDRRYKLILQPMTKQEVLRYWLVNNEFEIGSEELVLDNGIIYQVIVARFGGTTRLTDAELYTGRFASISRSPLFPVHIDRYIERFERAYAGIRSSAAADAAGKAAVIRNVLTQLKEAKHEHSQANT